MSVTYGQYLINKELPSEYKIKSGLTKKNFKSRMNTFAHKQPERYVRTITALKNLGDSIATTEGLSLGLDDIAPEYSKRNKFMKPLERRFQHAATDTAREKIVIEAQNRLLSNVMDHKGSLTLQVKSGARGNPVQYANMSSGVGYARNTSGGVVPWLITRSYSEGLKPSDYWALTNQSMMDVIKTQTAVSEPGELSKKLIAGMSDALITEEDCGTRNGILIITKSSDALDRYIAKDIGKIKRNTLITPTNQSAIAKTYPKILLRSPMTCEAADGICQRCQGLDEHGNTQTFGINVGVRSAQAMSEPLTQFALNAKHGGRTLASDNYQVTGISGFRQIIETPKQFMHKAVLASEDGRVTQISKAPQGGNFIYIEDTKHYVTPELKLKRKVGDNVYRGDVLSDGIPKPDEVVKYKGLGAGRLYMVKTLKDLYSTQGKDIDQRHFEILAKSSMNHVRILNDPGNAYIKGDVISYNNLRRDLSSQAIRKQTKQALGDTLGIAVNPYAAGTRITKEVQKQLISTGDLEIMVAPRAPEVEFIMKSATNVPKMHTDWLARMAHQGLKPTILQAAHMNETTDIHGTHPVPAYVLGGTFGEGSGGKY